MSVWAISGLMHRSNCVLFNHLIALARKALISGPRMAGFITVAPLAESRSHP
jgi:hypothetical protein